MMINWTEPDHQKGEPWVYAVTGNIKKTRIDENGILRYGTAAFKGKTKVYLCGRQWDERLPYEGKTEISVLGLSRSGKWYVGYIPINLIENLRIKKVHTPRVLDIMSNFEFCEGWWGNTQEEKDDAVAFLNRLKEEYGIE